MDVVGGIRYGSRWEYVEVGGSRYGSRWEYVGIGGSRYEDGWKDVNGNERTQIWSQWRQVEVDMEVDANQRKWV